MKLKAVANKFVYPLFSLICCLCLCLAGRAQQIIYGKVLDADTDNPLAAASIYFNNTSLGTASKQDGTFQLNGGALVTGELIVSSTGYEPISVNLQLSEASSRRYTFKLVPKKVTMENVLILSDLMRKKYLDKFVKNFLGMTEEADLSRITNLKSIYFRKNDDAKNGYLAFSDEPLQIVNKKLGYKIYFQLIEFALDEDKHFSSFIGFTRYESMGKKKQWVRNREAVYYGSTMHFFRALTKNRLEQEGFSIFLVNKDSLQGRQLAFKRKSLVDIARRITARDVVIKDTSDLFYIARWPDRLMVLYDLDTPAKRYLKNKMAIDGDMGQGFMSYLIANWPEIRISNSGILENPMSIFFSGFWAYEKAANLLPFDYYPDN